MTDKPSPEYRYQTVSFAFKVVFSNLENGGQAIDTRFQSVSGLNVEFDSESIKEGGENRFEHLIPSRTKYSNLVLKRGLLGPDSSSAITKWCKQTFESMMIKPANLEVELLNENFDPIMKWNVIHVWPKKWDFKELNAEKSEILIETLELHYNRFEFVAV